MVVQRCWTMKGWGCFWDLFLSDPWFLCKDLHLLLKVITLFGDLYGLRWLYGMSRWFMASAAYEPFLCIIPLRRKTFPWQISRTETENGPTRCWRSFHWSPMRHWAHSLSPPLSWSLEETLVAFGIIAIVWHGKWFDKLRCLFEIELAKWVWECFNKWVVLAFPIEACVALQWWFLNNKKKRKRGIAFKLIDKQSQENKDRAKKKENKCGGLDDYPTRWKCRWRLKVSGSC